MNLLISAKNKLINFRRAIRRWKKRTVKKAGDLLKEIEGELGEVSDENSDNEINAKRIMI